MDPLNGPTLSSTPRRSTWTSSTGSSRATSVDPGRLHVVARHADYPGDGLAQSGLRVRFRRAACPPHSELCSSEAIRLETVKAGASR